MNVTIFILLIALLCIWFLKYLRKGKSITIDLNQNSYEIEEKIIDPQKITYPECNTLFIPPIDAKFDKTYKARSESDENIVYQVNLTKLTCNCPDFIKNRNEYLSNDVRRICKHIYSKLLQTKSYHDLPPFIQMIARNGRKDKCFYELTNEAGRFVFGFSHSSPWVRIFAVTGEKRLRESFGSYNLTEDRWVWDDPPYGEGVLKKQIKSVFLKR
jgi:hypothetical protein